MSKYFDEDFFKFLLGFTAIIAFSLMILLVAKSYQNGKGTETASVIQSTVKK